ncbi:MAG: glycosyltransferase family 1 protein, partial [Anaerolineae bacterium]|nr:glycosyltransferase family 1 protein [Anaerolineae bacterium]
MQIALFTVTFLPRVDGVVTRLRYTIEHLQHLGHQVLVIAPDGGLTKYKGATIYGVSSVAFPLYPELKLAP